MFIRVREFLNILIKAFKGNDTTVIFQLVFKIVLPTFSLYNQFTVPHYYTKRTCSNTVTPELLLKIRSISSDSHLRSWQLHPSLLLRFRAVEPSLTPLFPSYLKSNMLAIPVGSTHKMHAELELSSFPLLLPPRSHHHHLHLLH